MAKVAWAVPLPVADKLGDVVCDLGEDANEEASPRGGYLMRALSEKFVPATYPGRALVQPSGVRLSDAAQRHAANLVGCAWTDCFRCCRHVELSGDDAEAFATGGGSFGADTYGELMPEGLLDILWRVGARPGDRFYDLGAGTGKLAALAWLAGLRSTGVELSAARWGVARQAVAELEQMKAGGHIPQGGRCCQSGLAKRSKGGLDYIRGSLLEVDFTDADVLFVSSVMFTKAMVAKVAQIARWMKPGSRIVSFHNFAELSQLVSFTEFEELGEVIEPTSWKEDTCFQVVQVVKNPAETEERPQHLKLLSEFDAAFRCGIAC